MTWIDRLDAYGRRLDASWEAWCDRNVSPFLTAGVMGVIEIGCPVLGLLALGYLFL